MVYYAQCGGKKNTTLHVGHMRPKKVLNGEGNLLYDSDFIFPVKSNQTLGLPPQTLNRGKKSFTDIDSHMSKEKKIC